MRNLRGVGDLSVLEIVRHSFFRAGVRLRTPALFLFHFWRTRGRKMVSKELPQRLPR